MQIINLFSRKTLSLVKREPFFFITLFITLIFALISHPSISAVNWSVISTLFSLMLVCQAFEQSGLLALLARAALGMFCSPAKLGLAMIVTTGVLAMLITNDVALLTVVPLTLTMAKESGKDPYMLIILETMSANLFSALTPFGNPQNLYLYSYYGITAGEFIKVMLPLCLLGAALLVVLNLLFNRGDAYKTESAKTVIGDKRLLLRAAAAFVIIILSILRVLDYRIALAATLIILFSPRLILKADYFLLATFVLFFLFTDSVTGISAVSVFFSKMLSSKNAVVLLSAAASQIISNVPTAVLLSGFTDSYKELLYGVSAGGLGTLVASLASLISYKLYIKKYKGGKYLKAFTLLNFGALIFLLAAVMII